MRPKDPQVRVHGVEDAVVGLVGPVDGVGDESIIVINQSWEGGGIDRERRESSLHDYSDQSMIIVINDDYDP